jgi:hypothetical protein
MASAGGNSTYIFQGGDLLIDDNLVFREGTAEFRVVGSSSSIVVGGDYNQNNGSGDMTLKFVMDAGGVNFLDVAGAVNLANDAKIEFDFSALSSASLGNILLVNNQLNDPVNGLFTNFGELDPVFSFGGTAYLLTYQYEAGGDGQFNDIALLAVPEPAALIVWAVLLGLAACRIRRRK